MAEATNPKLIRSFSASNLKASTHIHEYIADQEKSLGDRPPILVREVTKSSMIIPSLENMAPELRMFTLEMVIDKGILQDLEMEKSINWCSSCRNLVPLKAEGDGNCLMHALSMYVWGVHDRNLTLRRFIHKKMVLEDRFEGRLYKRWRRHQELQLNEIPDDDVRLDSQEYRKDWDTVVHISSCAQFPVGNRGPRYGQMEDIHIFAAANILARPIIVLCDNVYRSEYGMSIQPCRLGGIYLPLLRHPDECERTPIVIGYERGHFVPLVSCEDLNIALSGGRCNEYSQHCIPLVSHNMRQLSVHFLLEGEDRNTMINQYLDCSDLPYDSFRPAGHGSDNAHVLVAMIKFKSPPAWSVELMWSLFRIAKQQFNMDSKRSPNQQRTSSSFIDNKPILPISPGNPAAVTVARGYPAAMPPAVSQSATTKCVRNVIGCQNSGIASFKGMCENCYNEYMISSQNIPKRRNVGSLKSPTEMQPVATYASSVSPTNTAPANVLLNQVATGQCVKTGCDAVGLSYLLNMCKECYMKNVFPEVGNVPGHAGEGNVPGHVGEGNVPGHVGRNLRDDTAGYRIDGGIHENVVPTDQGAEAGIPVDRSETGTRVDRPSTLTLPKAKIFCDIPGCLENPEPGNRYCREHLNDGKAVDPCIGEGCNNKVVTGNEWNLCDTCLKKQLGQSLNTQSRNEPQHERSYQSQSNLFHAPSVYSGYPATTTPYRVTTQKIHDDDPQWHKQYTKPQNTPQATECRNGLCKNHANINKEGYCNACYELNRTFGNITLDGENRSIQQCVNEHCINPGRQDLNYLCQPCYTTQRQHVGNLPSPTNSRFSPTNARLSPTNAHVPASRPEMPTPYGVGLGAGSPYGNSGFQSVRKPEICMMDGCNNIADPIRNSMCDQCYRVNLYNEETFRRQQQQEEERARTKKLPLDSPYLNPIPCKTKGCPRTGVREKNEFCEICFNRNPQVKDLYGNKAPIDMPRYSSDTQAPAMQSPETPNQHVTLAARLSASSCLRQGCQYFGTQEFGGYCSGCFLNMTMQEAGQRLNSIGSQPASELNQGRGTLPFENSNGSIMGAFTSIQGDKKPEECISQGCDLFGRPDQRGYCSQCYRRIHENDVFVFRG